MEEKKVEEVETNEKEKKEGKKSKKKIIITIIIIGVLALVAIGSFVFYHKEQTAKLVEEVNKMSQLNMTNSDGTMKENPLDMEIKTTGSYAVVEQTLKDYMNEIVVETQNLADVLDEEKVTNLVSMDNLKEDGPDFTKSKEEIAKMRETVNNYVSKMEELANEENILTEIDDKDVGEYYKQLYKQLAVDEESSASMREAVEQLKVASTYAKQSLDDLEKIFNFLSENKNSWEIQGEQIVFNTQSAYNEYNELMNSLTTMQ